LLPSFDRLDNFLHISLGRRRPFPGYGCVDLDQFELLEYPLEGLSVFIMGRRQVRSEPFRRAFRPGDAIGEIDVEPAWTPGSVPVPVFPGFIYYGQHFD
jgi:hypothetical protein